MPSLGNLFDMSMESFLTILISTMGIYLAVIFYTRICGKRSFSKISSFDFAMTIAVGSLIASTILSESVSLLEGMVGIAWVYFLQLALAFLRRYEVFKKLVDNEPTLLMDGSNLLRDNMKNVRVTEGDIRSKLREANIVHLQDVKAVVFETTGNIVVIHGSDDAKVDEWLMKDVIR